MDGKIVSTRVVMIRFVESEASVPLITGKVNVAMGDSEEYILTDTVGNEIVESEGTTGSLYWKPNARKIHAVESSAFRQWRRRSSRSRNNDWTHVFLLLPKHRGMQALCGGVEDNISPMP
ncbi:hypothetical protein OYC64_021980 [Pagothenia borchgrevinki]|uniref:Uncharacterized protein n=2 Tax=Pagothenia borchgrevinki TaxID=8213 RepID=A0ABD2G1S7_PAGBO